MSIKDIWLCSIATIIVLALVAIVIAFIVYLARDSRGGK